jgi:two-component system, LytTR family, sensor kinase
MKKTDTSLRNFYFLTGTIVFFIGILGTLMYKGPFHHVLLNNLWAVVYAVALNYVFLERVLPFIVKKRKYLTQNIAWGFILFFIYIVLCSFGLYLWRTVGIQMLLYHPLKAKETFYGELENMMAYSAMAFFVFIIAHHIYTHLKLRQAAQKLRIEKQEAELNFLKSQTNPHFLFNTLNNIYTLAMEKSDLAPESIMRLSKILRYMLYETAGESITVEQEIKIISDYIALEQLRYDQTLRLTFNQDIDNMKQTLPPLLMIPLIENAFKHGAAETRTNPSIQISIQLKNKLLHMQVINTTDQATAFVDINERIGLSNLRRQMELLYTDYSLNLQQQSYRFIATLIINLNSHVTNQVYHSGR